VTVEDRAMDGDILFPDGFAGFFLMALVVFRVITPFVCPVAFFCVIAIMDKHVRCDRMVLWLSSSSFLINLACCASCLFIWLSEGDSSFWWVSLAALAVMGSGVAIWYCAKSQLRWI
jgi:hypothetical protein